jgi:hypothetical protein
MRIERGAGLRETNLGRAGPQRFEIVRRNAAIARPNTSAPAVPCAAPPRPEVGPHVQNLSIS